MKNGDVNGKCVDTEEICMQIPILCIAKPIFRSHMFILPSYMHRLLRLAFFRSHNVLFYFRTNDRIYAEVEGKNNRVSFVVFFHLAVLAPSLSELFSFVRSIALLSFSANNKNNTKTSFTN